MQKLQRMLFREILKSKGQFIAAVAVIFAGITLFTAFLSAYMNYKNSMNYYYKKCSFIDYYLDAQCVSPQLINKVKAIDGVSNAAGRISQDVGADVGKDKRVTVRLISLPDKHRPEINDVYIKSGKYFDSKEQDSCLVSSKFAGFYNLKNGDLINTIINQKIYQFKIAGIVDSPEFVYAMKSASDLTVSSEYFGIVFIKESKAQEILGMGKEYNQLLVTFKNETDSKKIIDKIEKMLKPYGFISGTKRKDQLSYNMVEQDFQQLQAVSVMFPLLFLLTAAMIICIMQKRIINNQRTIIGVMKALGYTNIRILWHYTIYSLLIAVIGSLSGDILGYYLGTLITRVFVQSLNVPVMSIRFYWGIELSGLAVSIFFCLIAGFSSARKTLKIHPAEAMRSEAPTTGKRIFLERIKPFWRNLSFGSKMIIRNILRSRQRSMLMMMGVAFTITLFMVSLFLTDSINYTIRHIFFDFQKQDYKVTFSKSVPFSEAIELDRIEGIKKSEPFWEVPVELWNGWRKQETGITGLSADSSMYNFQDNKKMKLKIPEDGILISESTADKLKLDKGDIVAIKLLDGEKDKRKYTVVSGVIKQNMGATCYMNIKSLGRLTGCGRVANGTLLNILPGTDEKISRELFKMPSVSTIESKVNAYNGLTDVLSTLYAFSGIMIIFGTIMGFAIIFNTTVINIMERRRELASLKVLGYNKWEIERTILGENLLVGGIGVLPGILLGRVMCEVFGKGMGNDTISIEVIISQKNYVISFLSVFVLIIVAQLFNRKAIHGLDMVDVLKNREG